MEKIKCPNCGEMVEPEVETFWGVFVGEDDEFMCICPKCGAKTYRYYCEKEAIDKFKDGKFSNASKVKKKDQQPDMINHPSHYINANGVECSDVVEFVLDNLELTFMAAYWLGCTLKYLFRYRHKGNPMQDLDKAERCFKNCIKCLKKDINK